MTKKPNSRVRITCGTNLKTNERLIEIQVMDGNTFNTIATIEMTPQDFAESLVSHVDRAAYYESQKN